MPTKGAALYLSVLCWVDIFVPESLTLLRAGRVHNLTDANRLFPGEGVINLHKFKMNLEGIGYDGFLSLEVLRPSYWVENPAEMARIGRESLKQVFGV